MSSSHLPELATVAEPRVPTLSIAKPSRFFRTVNARWRRAALDEGLVSALLANYGVIASRTPRTVPFGARNVHVLVTTPSGRKVLKQYRERWTESTVAYEHAVLRRLGEVGFPSVRVNPTLSGDTVVASGGRLHALFDFVPGTTYTARLMPYRSRLRLLTRAGLTLGELHRELAGFTPEAVHHLGFRSATLDRTHDLAWYRETLDGLRLRQYSVPPDRASDADELSRRADEIESRLDRLVEELERADLPRVVIHGDFGIHNLVFRPDGTVVVFDFELARLEWRLVDLVIVLSRALPQSGRVFLDGYRRSNEIRQSEWEFLPLVWEFHLLAGAIRSWRNFVDQGGAHRVTIARRRLEDAGDRRILEVARWF